MISFEFVQKTQKALRVLDWVLGAGTLIAGVLMRSQWISVMGVLGLLLAWYNPAARLQKLIATRIFISRRINHV